MKKITGVLAGTLMMLMFAGSGRVAVLLQQTDKNSSSGFGYSDISIAQSIQENISLNNVKKVTIALKKSCGANDGCIFYDVTVSIRTDSDGIPSSTVLASQTISASAIPFWSPYGTTALTVVFENAVNFQANTKYWIHITTTNGGGYLIGRAEINETYVNGKYYFFYQNQWMVQNYNSMYFVLESPPTPPLKMPFRSGYVSQCVQGVNGDTTHQVNNTKYDLDLNTSNYTDEDVTAASGGIAYTHSDAGPNSFGNHITIDHGNGYFTLYAHLKSFSVTNGQSVFQGQIIGKEGCTGFCYGDHLHFGLHTGDPTTNALNSTSVLIEQITAKDVTIGGSFVDMKSDEFVCDLYTGHSYESNNPVP